MKVVVVGSGGREHALARALAGGEGSPRHQVVVAPGNPGMEALGVTCVAAGADAPSPDAVALAALDADLYVVGPEAPLVAGLADQLRAAGRVVFGPGADGARLEGSKAWMKDLLAAAGVPTARYQAFGADQEAAALAFLRGLEGPWVVKTDGLAAGKGVLVTDDLARAEADVVAKLSGRAFGAAGRRVVVEEYLAGEELSVMAVCDGVTAVALAPAQDFKRAFDGDEGPNTGGMGAYSPVPAADPAVVDAVMASAVQPTLEALRAQGIDFRGVLYAGVVLTAVGPKVLEFNVRFGDPETQVVLPRLSGDLAAFLRAAASGRLDDAAAPGFAADAAVCVVLASPGYPESPRTGDTIFGLQKIEAAHPAVQAFSAGVARGDTGRQLVTAGGRVLGVTATGPSLVVARRRVYDAVLTVSWPGMHYRTDIAAAAAASDPAQR